MSAQEFRKLYQLKWLPLSSPEITPALGGWLAEEDSMTVRLERYCSELTVEVVQEGFIGRQALLPHESGYSGFDHESRFWLREVILYGDGTPWLMGRTILPETTLTGPEKALMTLGKLPLGRYLFSSPLLSRDFIQPGQCDDVWGRYSLLRLSGKPLILTEVFLPLSPLYTPGRKDTNPRAGHCKTD